MKTIVEFELKEAVTFIYYTFLWADGEISKEETEILSTCKLFVKHFYKESLDDWRNRMKIPLEKEEISEMLHLACSTIKTGTTEDEKKLLIEDILVLMISDGDTDEIEISAVTRIAMELDITPETVSQIAADITKKISE